MTAATMTRPSGLAPWRGWRGARLRATAGVCLLAVTASACAPLPLGVKRQVVAPREVPIQLGSPARDNLTPMEASLACFAHTLTALRRKPVVIGVGEIKDFTGRYSINEGNVVTQGGSLMLFSALGKMGGTVRIAERYDPSIAERELAYMDRRQLGNGQPQEVNGQRVPWLPYFGGTVQASDYYIVGGITEVNYNLSSGGAEAAIDNIGFKGRTYSQSIALDLRIVDSRSLVVMDAISLSKQYVGYEVGANTFRFFGIGLVNVNLGAKGQEPLQLGIRATIEEAAIRLVARVNGINPAACLALRTDEISTKSSEAIFTQLTEQEKARAARAAAAGQGRPPAAPARAQPARPASTAAAGGQAKPAGPTSPATPPQQSRSLNDNSASAQGAAALAIAFEVGNPNLSAPAQAVLDRAATVARQGGSVNLSLLSPETEKLEPGQRSRLLDQRIASLVLALASRGIPAAAVTVAWRPQATDSTTYREQPGVQLIAKIKLMR